MVQPFVRRTLGGQRLLVQREAAFRHVQAALHQPYGVALVQMGVQQLHPGFVFVRDTVGAALQVAVDVPTGHAVLVFLTAVLRIGDRFSRPHFDIFFRLV